MFGVLIYASWRNGARKASGVLKSAGYAGATLGATVQASAGVALVVAGVVSASVHFITIMSVPGDMVVHL